jgi:anti-sigma-K factor RskA
MSGDVVWNPVTQQGFLRFVGLRPNDPQMHQYQLWIFDAARDQRYPVDGGVFDVPANQGEVVVPIRAALPVGSAKAFAVTIEKPGGVVVSGRQHIVALGQAS